ncbi:GNAT family N-acetyltransferase [Devosia rhizoryzae]|uniref:GNAT family N-acetyltransferase n=1 Tax=Devosia rhizoryzae TaxID=2774137 RepID=A0ABX7C4N8_9HYPH|nr:GNAT family N-acetyltransferase [Devosia rhizoryzae]QQR39181.1 GNAT family N-acetyltransferase [Devosia rhizoryzae]
MTTTTPASSVFDVSVLYSIEAAEAVWRGLEAVGVFTPYQRLDWLSQLIAAGAESKSRVAIAVISRDGQVQAILPLAIHTRFGLRTARLLGTDYSNVDWMIAAPGFTADAEQLHAIVTEIAQQVGGIDILSLQNLPASWNGMANPLLQLPHTLAPSNFYFTSIAGVQKPFITTRLTPKRRGDLQRSRRRMEEAMGKVELIRVEDAAMLEHVHQRFLEQRRERFDEMGVDNVFEEPVFRAFFHEAALAGFGQERPALLVHSLMANGAVTATSWGTTAGDHYSLYINSTESGDASRFSLMSILIADLMDDLIDMGITSFDIGLGDFHYKARWTEPQPVYNSLLPLTAAGRLAALALTGRSELKRTIKQNPKLWQAASGVRRVLHHLRPGK